MRRATARLLRDDRGAVAPIVALALFGLVAAGGLAFDYSRMASLDTELQDAADQAALAAATQLDGKAGAITRAESAAQALIRNDTRFANDGDADGSKVTITALTFYDSYDQGSDSFGSVVTDDAKAAVVKVTTKGREAFFALTPVVAVLRSGNIQASATAGVGEAVCKVPPVMICNPDEPAGNTDELYDFNPAVGHGIRLITGNATAPGNFGWLDSNIGNGANALAEAMGYNTPPGDCSPITGVTTKPGMTTSVLDALNTRFDVFANGNSTCPSQDGGTCSPSANTRKDLVCQSSSGTSCLNDNWSESANPYRPTSVGPLSGSADPDVMGYPRDMCQAVPAGTAGACGIMGDGNWDRDAYFRVNYKWMSRAAWTAATGLPADVTRYQVYQWELDHPSAVGGDGKAHGIGVPQNSSGNNYAFGEPATGRAGVTPGGSLLDRRRISVAVLNCQALTAKGKTTNVPVAKWLDVFLVQPSYTRGKGSVTYTDKKEVYVEVIGVTAAGVNGSTNSQVVQRSVPYLIR